MKYSYRWLKELSGTKKKSTELMKMVGLKGFELEGSEDLSKRFEKFVVGEILEFHEHPNADKLRLVRVSIGEEEETQIVCGASNFEVWDKVPVALIGAVVPQNKMQIEKREVRGEFSNGMLCAEDELGFGKDHEGIMILDKNLKVGTPLAEVLDMNDVLIDFDILPNRAHDCMNHVGMAREIATMEGSKLENEYIELDAEISNEGLEVEIQNKDICPRYIGAILENIEIKASPRWMQSRLIASGMEPINNVVDITNYVMLETGSPMHAFDFGNVSNNAGDVRIVIRNAKEEEKLELLDGKEIELDQRDLVIANENQALALAGIKGGKNSGIENDTKTLVLESANFEGFNVRKTRQRHGLLTESQARFEKGISPRLAQHAMARAIDLLKEHANAQVTTIQDADFSKQEVQKQTVQFEYVESLLGERVEKEDILKIISNLGFEIENKTETSFGVNVPFWRLDIEGQADLVEEVGRIIGYDEIKEKDILENIAPAKKNSSRQFEWKVSDYLRALEFDEIRSYSFYSEKDIATCGIKKAHFEIENPLSEELSFMRTSLIPNIIKSAAQNVKYFSKFSTFEIGRNYYVQDDGESAEELSIAGAIFETSLKDEELFYLAKGKIEALLSKLTDKRIKFDVPGDFENDIYHRTRTAQIFVGDGSVGILGQMNKTVAKKFGVKKPVAIFELNFEKLLALVGETRNFEQIDKFPMVLRDLSMFVGLKTRAAQITEEIESVSGKLLREIDLFDVYEDREAERKSLAFHLSFGREDGTLENKQVDQMIEQIIERLEKIGAQVRTK